MMQQPTSFASLLKRHRDAAGLTQEELAERAQLGVRTISDLERGISTAPYRTTIRRLADALGISADDRDELQARARRPVEQPASGAGTPIQGGFLGAVPPARLVARDHELGRLLDALAAVERGSGRVVLLAGEPGIGKTRLAQEASVYAWERRFLVAAGRCYETQRSVPFYPFLELLGTLYQAATPQLRAAIPERWPYVARLLPDHVPSQAATTVESQEEAQRLLRAVTGFVRAIAAERPVACLLDDLQWADGASLDLLAHLARHTRSDRVLLLAAYRDVDVGRRHPLRTTVRELDREQLVVKIDVRRLGQAETAALMSDRLDGADVSEAFAALVYGRTEGNPFFTVEVLKDLIERGDLFRWEGRWLRKEIQDLAAPQSVSEAILERVARLQPRTQEVLAGASVLGQAFSFEQVLAVADLGEDGTEAALEEAEAAGLVRAAGEHYTFDHALTQQALYAVLLPVRRTRFHRAAGAGLEQLGERARRTRAAEIAGHFLNGGWLARALPYALLAGEQAEAVFAHAEAEQHYRSALELAEAEEDAAASARAWEKLGGVLAAAIRYNEALAALERAAGGYRTGDDAEGVSRVEARIAQTHFRRGTPQQGIARLSAYLEALDTPGAAEDVRRRLVALYGALARLYYAHGHYAACRDAAERGVRISGAGETIGALAEAEMMRGTGLLWSDAPDEGVTALQQAVRLAEQAAVVDTLCTALLPLHLAYMARGEFERSRACGERGAIVAQTTGDTGLLAMHTANLGMQHFYLGTWREANEQLERAVELARSTHHSYFAGLPSAYLGVLRTAQGAWKDAARCYREALTLSQAAGNPEVVGYAEARLLELDIVQGRSAEAIARLPARPEVADVTWWYDVLLFSALAEANIQTGDANEAEALAEFALNRARLMYNWVDGLDASRIHARSLAMQGRLATAIATLEQALAHARSMPYPYAEARLQREYGIIHVREQQPGKARVRLAAALEIFQRLGAKKDAARTRRTLQELEVT